MWENECNSANDLLWSTPDSDESRWIVLSLRKTDDIAMSETRRAEVGKTDGNQETIADKIEQQTTLPGCSS